MKKEQKITFKQFLKRFPKIDLPVTLTEEIVHEFSRAVLPLPAAMIEQFILSIDTGEVDEFTEYIPCFKLPKIGDCYGIVYWKALLLNYEYVLVTFDKKGNFIEKQVISGTKVEGESLVRSVATIDEQMMIYIVGGVASAKDNIYNASSSLSSNLQLLATGRTFSSLFIESKEGS